jgi:ABC-type multidrug transport system ATPase subunit
MDIAGNAFLGANRYGPLQPNFSLTLPRTGYHVLVGPNNFGKSSILQFIFTWAARVAGSEIGGDRVALLLPDREFVNPTTQTGGRTLGAWNNDLMGQIASAPLLYDQTRGAPRNELLSVLVNHKDFLAQANRLLGFLDALGLPKPVLIGNQQINFENIVVYSQGSGLRSLLTILSALTSSDLKLVCIDEPELSLEPRVQKALRDLLIKEAKDRLIIVATHSHLFLNRQEHASNHTVGRADNGDVTVNTVSSEDQLYDIAFQLLGNDTEDLFFPGNYLVVEGASDQVICEAALRLLGVPQTRVKVLSSGGVTNVEGTLNGVLNSLKPLVLRDSPYAKRVVALIDKSTDKEGEQAAKLKALLPGRFFELDRPALEEYLPSSLFDQAQRQQAGDLEQIARLRAAGSHTELGDFKRTVSNAIAGALTVDDLQLIPKIREAVEMAANWEGR